jgi:hypothetical protein
MKQDDGQSLELALQPQPGRNGRPPQLVALGSSSLCTRAQNGRPPLVVALQSSNLSALERLLADPESRLDHVENDSCTAGHALPCLCCMSMSMFMRQVYIHAACPCRWSMLNFHVLVHAACFCCMSMSIMHIHFPCCMSISMMLPISTDNPWTWTWNTDMEHGHRTRTWTQTQGRGHEHEHEHEHPHGNGQRLGHRSGHRNFS